MKKLLYTICFFIPNWLLAQYMELDNYHVEVGDSIVVIVRFEDSYTRIQKVKFDLLDSIPSILSISGSENEYSTTTGKVYSKNFLAVDTGLITIPPATIIVEDLGTTQNIITNSVTLKITNPKVDSMDTVLEPIKDIEEVKIYWYDNWLLYLNILLAILLVLILYFAFRKKKKNVSDELITSVETIPPFELAMTRLDELEKSDLLNSGHIIAFYTELSHIYREYLNNALGIDALEASTTEIKSKMESTDFDQTIKYQSNRLLELYDKVKFAKQTYSNEINESMLNNLRFQITSIEQFLLKNNQRNEDTFVS